MGKSSREMIEELMALVGAELAQETPAQSMKRAMCLILELRMKEIHRVESDLNARTVREGGNGKEAR